MGQEGSSSAHRDHRDLWVDNTDCNFPAFIVVRLAEERAAERQRNLVTIYCDVTSETVRTECQKMATEVIR